MPLNGRYLQTQHDESESTMSLHIEISKPLFTAVFCATLLGCDDPGETAVLETSSGSGDSWNEYADDEPVSDDEAHMSVLDPTQGTPHDIVVSADPGSHDGVVEQHEWGFDDLAQPPVEPAGKFLSTESGYQIFTWKKGMPEVKMGAVAEKVCFLGGLQGAFMGGNDVAETFAVNGEYRLRGLGNVTEVTAVCLSTKFVKHTATYATSSTVDVSSTLDRACFLSSVRGKFDGSVSGLGFTGAEVRKLADTQKWRVRVQGTGGKVYVRCITGANDLPLKYSSETAWLKGQASAQLESPVSQPCLLTRLSGNYSSTGDWAGLWLQESLDGVLQQMLGGYGAVASTSAASRCVDT